MQERFLKATEICEVITRNNFNRTVEVEPLPFGLFLCWI